MGGDLFGIGFGELLFLAVLALLVFGPRRIPEIARGIGRFIRQVRQATGGIDQEVRQWMQGVERPEDWLRENPPAGRPPLPPLEAPAPGRPEPTEPPEPVKQPPAAPQPVGRPLPPSEPVERPAAPAGPSDQQLAG